MDLQTNQERQDHAVWEELIEAIQLHEWTRALKILNANEDLFKEYRKTREIICQKLEPKTKYSPSLVLIGH